MGLHHPPIELETEVFTRLPDIFRIPGQVSEWVKANAPGQHVDCFLEGPSFDRDGNLYLVDIPYGRIFRISPEGSWSLVCEYDGWPNGLKIHNDGRIFIADYKNGIMQLDVDSGEVLPVLTHRNSESFKGVNDLVFDNLGRLYFTDQGQTGMHDPTGRVYRFDMDKNRLECLLDNGPSPNGLVLNPEETVLYVAMTRGNAVWRLPLRDDGPPSKVGIFTQLAGGVVSCDGLAMDERGRLFVCDAGNGSVWVFNKWAEPIYRIQACVKGRATTNLAFGGPENKDLFIVESSTGSILRASLDIPGRRMFSHS